MDGTEVNLRNPSEILETEVVAAIARIAAVDSGLGDDAQHVYDMLTGAKARRCCASRACRPGSGTRCPTST